VVRWDVDVRCPSAVTDETGASTCSAGSPNTSLVSAFASPVLPTPNARMDERSWSGIGSFDLAKLTAYQGGNYRRLGDHGNAIRVLDTALANLDPSMLRHRATALIDRAEAHYEASQIDAACADARAALALVADTQHIDTMNRAEKIARSILTSNSRGAHQLWQDVLSLKATIMTRP
jgi:hypothetical protein